MGAIHRPKVRGFERCRHCGLVVWRCRGKTGPVDVHPHPLPGGNLNVLANGDVDPAREADGEPRYAVHVAVCPELQRRSLGKSEEEGRVRAVAEAVAEGRRQEGWIVYPSDTPKDVPPPSRPAVSPSDFN